MKRTLSCAQVHPGAFLFDCIMLENWRSQSKKNPKTFKTHLKKWNCVHTALKSNVSLTFQCVLDLSVHLPVLKHLPLKWKPTSLYARLCKLHRKTLFTYGESGELCSLKVSATDVVWTGHSTRQTDGGQKRRNTIASSETHPIPARSTKRGAAPRQTRPRWWACGGRCPRTASRSSWRCLCTPSAQPGTYSSPETEDTGRSERCLKNKTKQNNLQILPEQSSRFHLISVARWNATWRLTGLLLFMAWLLSTDSESHMMVTMELKMNERNVFLWREILWQLRLLGGGAGKGKGKVGLVVLESFKILNRATLLLYADHVGKSPWKTFGKGRQTSEGDGTTLSSRQIQYGSIRFFTASWASLQQHEASYCCERWHQMCDTASLRATLRAAMCGGV